MKKILFLACLLLLLTGCTAKYDIKINEDLSVNESIYMYGDEELFDTYYKTTRVNVLKELLEPYEDLLKENKYQYEVNQDGYIYIFRKYDNIKECIDNSILFNDYFEKINYTKNGDKIKIETEGFHPNSTDDPERFYVDDLTISITSSYKVTNNNATSINDDTNTYSFNLKGDMDDFKVMFEMDTTSKFNPNMKMYITIGVTVLIIIGAWITVLVLNKKKNG